MKTHIQLLAVAAGSFALGAASAAHGDDTLSARVTAALPTVDAVAKAVMGEVTYLSPGEIEAATVTTKGTLGRDRAWEYLRQRAGCADI